MLQSLSHIVENNYFFISFYYICTMNLSSGTVAFTGHRNYDNSENENLRMVVTSLYDKGAREFRVGMAEGFDLAAAEAVLELRREHRDVRLEAYVPWPYFFKGFTPENEKRYFRIIAAASVVKYVANAYVSNVFHRRNDMLVEGADYLVAWWNGCASGTGYTVRQAKRLGVNVVNLYPSSQLTMRFND